MNLRTRGGVQILLTYFMKARYLRHLSVRGDLKLNGETEGEGGGSYSVIDPRGDPFVTFTLRGVGGLKNCPYL